MSRYFSKLAQRTGLKGPVKTVPGPEHRNHALSSVAPSSKNDANHDDLTTISEVRVVHSNSGKVTAHEEHHPMKGLNATTQILSESPANQHRVDPNSVSYPPVATYPAGNEVSTSVEKSSKRQVSPQGMGEFSDSETPQRVVVKPETPLSGSSLSEDRLSEHSSEMVDMLDKSNAPQKIQESKKGLSWTKVGEVFGVSAPAAEKTREVAEMEPGTSVPGSNKFIAGVLENQGLNGNNLAVEEKGESPGFQPVSHTLRTTDYKQISAEGEMKSGRASNRKRDSVEINIGTISMEIYQSPQSKPEPQVFTPSPVVKNNNAQPPSSRLSRFYLRSW